MVLAFKLCCEQNREIALYQTLSGLGSQQRKDLLHSRASGQDIEVVLLGRLHYLPSGLANLRPAEALLQQFARRGERLFESLEGEFSFILIDRRNRQIYAGRDLNGSWPLYCSKSEETLKVSTHLRAVCDSTDLSEDYLGEYLASSGPVTEQATPNTVYRNAERVVAGTVRCWSFALEERVLEIGRPSVEAPSHNLDELASAFKEKLADSIAQRSQGRLGCQLSAGLDSTSVAALASRASSWHESPIVATSLVYDRGELEQESPLIRLMARSHHLRLRKIDMRQCLDFESSLEHYPVHDEPYPGLLRHGMSKAMIQACDEEGVQSLLTGSGGDEALDCNLDVMADLLSAFRIVRLYRELRRWSQVQNRSLPAIFGRHALWPLLAKPASRLGWRVKPLAAWNIPEWITPACKESLELRRRTARRVTEHFQSPFAHSRDRLARLTATGDWTRWHLAAPLGLNCSHPFRDSRVMDFCAQIPLRFKNDSPRKLVLRQAMKNILPDSIRLRKRKVGFNEPFWLGLRRALPKLEEMVRYASLPAVVEINRDKALLQLQRAAHGAVSAQAMSRLMSLVSLMLWFGQPPVHDNWKLVAHIGVESSPAEMGV